jgi:hypothetical protein
VRHSRFLFSAYYSMKTAPCTHVQIAVRRAARHPIIRSGTLIHKRIIRSATLGLVPDGVNDVAFHHAHIDFFEIIHVLQDATAIGTLSLALGVVTLASRSALKKRS